MIYKHGFVPDDFGKGLCVPLLKDRSGDHSALDNYRPITLSLVLSKVFEYCLLHKFFPNLYSSELQFGFKKGIGCSDAIFCVKPDCGLLYIVWQLSLIHI